MYTPIKEGRISNFSEVWAALESERDYYPVPCVKVAIFRSSAVLGMPGPDCVWVQFTDDAPIIVNRVEYTGRVDLDLGPVPGSVPAEITNMYLSRPRVYTPSLMGPTDAARRTVKTEVANLVTGYMGSKAGRELVRLATLRWHMDRRADERRKIAILSEDLATAATTVGRHNSAIRGILGGLDKPDALAEEEPTPNARRALFSSLATKYFGWLEDQLYDPDPDPRLEEGDKGTQEQYVLETLIELMEEVTNEVATI